ncbi:hypothetical protein EDB81DRAFT_850699 [Dactylonectria macrodidyma]|uniref:DUF7704 domain-containing protein n=1 Tax=Dactylonectria macrodidyma TaxID=307937 RepID=A0A9P9FVA0_9HYPO|nr:hypothetical protein EDB81DRAFT_850699 [Dactylonectria macrodidyma]
MADQIHPIYRIWFLWVDPVLTLAGIYGNLFNHDLATMTFFANYPPTEELKPFVYLLGGMGGSFFCLFVLLLRYTHDVNVWKIVQFGILWADFAMLTGMYVGMRLENRVAISNWRMEDWVGGGITVACTLLRALFVLGVGVRQSTSKAKRV